MIVMDLSSIEIMLNNAQQRLDSIADTPNKVNPIQAILDNAKASIQAMQQEEEQNKKKLSEMPKKEKPIYAMETLKQIEIMVEKSDDLRETFTSI